MALLWNLRLQTAATSMLITRMDNGGSGTAVIGPDQFKHGLLVGAYIFDFELDPSLREVGLSRMAGRSAGLAVDHNFLL